MWSAALDVLASAPPADARGWGWLRAVGGRYYRYVEKGRIESPIREGIQIPVIERDECIDLKMLYECDEFPNEVCGCH